MKVNDNALAVKQKCYATRDNAKRETGDENAGKGTKGKKRSRRRYAIDELVGKEEMLDSGQAKLHIAELSARRLQYAVCTSILTTACQGRDHRAPLMQVEKPCGMG